LDEQALIGNFNTIAGLPKHLGESFSGEASRRSELRLGQHSSITHSHIIDCTNAVEIGAFATLAGWRSQILTHSIDVTQNKQRSAPVRIGAFSFVGTGCILLKGTALPERSVLGAGSVLATSETEPLMLYSGVPATGVKSLDPHSKYFIRHDGVVR
jgi:acetyltransferase-like isoleucine patch superfamily enzyme